MQKPEMRNIALKEDLPVNLDLVIFDWDGTAVPDRKTPVPNLMQALEAALTEAGMICVVVTGTNVNNLLTQGLDSLSREAKQSLFLCTNRGSEAWGFDSGGDVTRLHYREATLAENDALDQAVKSIQRDVAALGLKTEIISDRLNRRKLDLIPGNKWADPKKSEFRELLAAVTERLQAAHIRGDLSTLIEDAYRISRAAGLSSPRITSDIKHIEVGLTDKSDSVRWAYGELIHKRKIPTTRIAVIGDEFGSIGGIQGSDAMLHIPELINARFISVGVEPEGVPSFVEHRGGGPDTFIQLLERQTLSHLATDTAPQREDDSIAWQVIQEGVEPSREREMEALFAIGNGYMGVRATADFPIPAAQPDLFIAGVYDKKAETLPYSETAFLTHGDRKSLETEIVPFPSPFRFQLRVGQSILSAEADMKTHTRTLDLKNGLYREEHRFEDASGRATQVHSMRCASLTDPHLLIQRIRIHSENYSDSIELDLSNDFSPYSALYPHLDVLPGDEGFPMDTKYQTRGSKIDCTIASRAFFNESELTSPSRCFNLKSGESIELVRVMSIFTSRDTESPLQSAREHLSRFNPAAVSESIRLHTQEWHEFWVNSDLTFQDNLELNQAQRFNLYHLRIAANGDPKVSIPAKALTGRAYEGHVFWDTEIFIFQFLLYNSPKVARNLLLYRYYTLDGARKRAKEMGRLGACYAWESTVSGLDVTPRSILVGDAKEEIPIFTGTQQIHVTADVAFALWKYWDATLDEDFLCNYGAEMLAETARFWVSRVSRQPEIDDLYHILGVVGPDEYHHGIDDNAYTNWMARFNLEKSAWAFSYIKDRRPKAYAELARKLHLHNDELVNWSDVARRLFIPLPDKDGIIEEFRGFRALKTIPIPENERHHAPVSRLFNWKETNKLRIVKQADVLMIPFLFPDAFPKEVVAANYNYYEPLTDHGSSLSLCVYAAIAAQIGLEKQARTYWEKSLNFDLANTMSNTALGIHIAAIGGSWQTLVFHLLGAKLTKDGVSLRNESVSSSYPFSEDVALNLNYRGKWHSLLMSGTRRLAA